MTGLQVGGLVKVLSVRTIEQHKKGLVYTFKLEEYNAKGIIFPNDDVIFPGNDYYVKINQVVGKNRGLILLTDIYHELEVGSVIPIRISQISHRGQPIFKLAGYFGFVKDSLQVGDKAKVLVRRVIDQGGEYKLVDAVVAQRLHLI